MVPGAGTLSFKTSARGILRVLPIVADRAMRLRVGLDVGVKVRVGSGVGVAVGVNVEVGVSVGVGVSVSVGDAVAVAMTVTTRATLRTGVGSDAVCKEQALNSTSVPSAICFMRPTGLFRSGA